MTSSVVSVPLPTAVGIVVTDDSLIAELSDGRKITVPLAWYPRLVHATSEERRNWQLIGKGEGIHWPDLDEDLSVEGFIKGLKSGESPKSFQRWLDAKNAGRPLTLDALREYERSGTTDE